MPNISRTVYVRADNRVHAAFNLSAIEKSTDIVNNTSVVSWHLKGSQGGISFIGTDRAKGCLLKVWVNGQCVSSRDFGLLDTPATVDVSGELTITHDEQGKKTITCTLEIDAGKGNYTADPWTYGAATGSFTLDLTDLPRLTTLSVPALVMGSAGTLTLTRQSSSFTEKLSYTMGTASGDITMTAGAASVSFTPPLSLASQLPRSTSGTITITCQTLLDGTALGSVSVKADITIPKSVKPTISSVTEARVSDVVPASWGRFVQGLSGVTVSITGAAGAYGSTITGYQISGAGSEAKTQSMTTPMLQKTGTLRFYGSVTDSRGRTSDAKSVAIVVQPYAPPCIKGFSFQRCTADGTASPSGTCCLASITYDVSTVDGKNTATVSCSYRKSGTTSWTDAKVSGVSSGTSFVFGSAALSTEYTWEIQFTIKDTFNTVTGTAVLPTALVTIDAKAGGKAVAIGKVAEHEQAFEVNSAWSVYAYGHELKAYINSLILAKLEACWPVGSLYISTTSTDPSKLLGFGTWQAYGAGQALVGVGTFSDGTTEQTIEAGKAYGEYEHALSRSELPKLYGQVVMHSQASATNIAALSGVFSSSQKNTKKFRNGGTEGTTADSFGIIEFSAGGDAAHNNIQPSIGVYIWKRTA